MVDTGILSNSVELPFHECLITFWILTITMTPSIDQTFNQTMALLLPSLTFYRKVSMEQLQRCSMPPEDAHFSGHLIPSHSGLTYALLVETNTFFPKLVVIVRTLHFEDLKVLSQFYFKETQKNTRQQNHIGCVLG